jgi:predicted RecA/RadA family phage recombinase
MATAQFLYDGNTINYTPVSDVSAGDVIVQGDLIGIAKHDIAAGQLGALAVVGIFSVPKAADEITAGAKLYWNSATKQVALVPGTEPILPYLGKAVRAAVSADTTVQVRLEQ